MFNYIQDALDALYINSSNMPVLDKGAGSAAAAWDMLDRMKNLSEDMIQSLQEYKYALKTLYTALRANFEKHGSLTAGDVLEATSEFNERGFASEKARALVMFFRGMFLDDSQDWSRRMKCVGVSTEPRSSYLKLRITFENSETGDQFQIVVPFTYPDKSDDFYPDDLAFDYPVYSVCVPGLSGDYCVVAKSIDPEVVRKTAADCAQGLEKDDYEVFSPREFLCSSSNLWY